MKHIKLIVAVAWLLVQTITAVAQFGGGSLDNPVRWSYSIKNNGNAEVELIAKATVQNDWHLYSQFFDDGGPIKLTLTFAPNANYKLIGKAAESPKPHMEMDEIFGVNVGYFSKEATFTQKIKVLSEKDFNINLTIEGQACYEKDGKCIMVEGENTFSVKGAKQTTETLTQVTENVSDTTLLSDEAAKTDSTLVEVGELKQESIQENTNEPAEDQSLLWFFLISVGLGLLGLVTPCVFPMIPMTVNFFMMSSGGKKSTAIIKALIFGFSVLFLYTAVGALVSLTGADPDFAAQISTNYIVNLVFFTVFIVFAASFFGMFEITLPASWVNKADQQVDKGGMVSAFFMALTLVLVSFSCTGPFVGTILVEAAGGAVVKPLLGMFGFGLGFAIPFTLLALFPQALKAMPKSGGWLNVVKVVFGFVILAFSMKFLNTAATTMHWTFLTRDVFIAIWIALFGTLGLYLIGKIKLSHDSDIDHIGVPRLGLAIASFAFVVYMIPGLFGAPLTALSAFLPAESSHSFDVKAMLRDNAGSGTQHNKVSNICGTPKHADLFHLPHGLEGYFDYNEALACAKEQNKPIFVDFTGHGCANCKEMEQKVWSNPEVLKRLRENFVIVALYIDDRTELPEAEWVTTENGKVLKTIGKINSDFRMKKFNANTQPYYFILDSNGNQLTEPMAYNLNVDEFIAFLDKGIAK